MTGSSVVRVIVLVALGSAVYANALNDAPVFDDISAIIENPTLRPPLHLSAILSPPTDTTVAGRPVANLTFALDNALFGPSLEALHATNIAIHIAAAVVLMLLMEATLRLPSFGGGFDDRAGWLALAAAAVWLVHPLQTESVTYLSQRVEALMGLFLFVTLYACVQAWTSNRKSLWGTVAVVACALGMGSKEVMAVAPILVLLYDRAFLFTRFTQALRARATLYSALAATWGIVVVLALSHPRELSAGLHFDAFTPWDYLRIQCVAINRYLLLALWPTNLVFDYGEGGASGAGVPQAWGDWLPVGLMLAGLLLLSLIAWRRRPGIGFVGVAFFLVLAPSSSIVPIRTEAIAEHRMYVPLAALVVLLAVVADDLILELRTRVPARTWSVLLPAVSLGVVGSLAMLTIERNRDYATALNLWQDTTWKWPANVRALGSLGLAAEAVGDEARAEKVLEHATFVQPNDFLCHYHLGRLRARRGDCEGALKDYAFALGTLDNDGLVEFRDADCLAEIGQLPQAAEMYGKALVKKPRDAEFETHLALLLWRMGRSDAALEEHRVALQHWPEWAEGHALYARTLEGAGKRDEARAEMDRALKLEPNLGSVHAESGRLAASEGRWADARRELELAVRREVDLRTEEDLAWVLATSAARDPQEAVGPARDAVALSEGRRRWRDLAILAAALAGAGDTVGAKSAAHDSLRLLGDQPSASDESLRAVVVAIAQGGTTPEHLPAMLE